MNVHRVGSGPPLLLLHGIGHRCDCGHLPMIDAPDLVAETILATTGARSG